MNASGGPERRSLRSIVLLSGTRLVNVGVGIVAIPALLFLLKNEKFAAWAVLFALSLGFALLDAGVPASVRRFLAAPYASQDWKAAERILASAVLCPVLTFGMATPVILAYSGALAELLRLPDTPFFNASGLVRLVFFASASQAILQVGLYGLYAAGEFLLVSRFSVVQPALAILAALTAALLTGRLDATVSAYWILQIGVSLFSLRAMLRRYPVNVRQIRFDSRYLRQMLSHGLSVQVGRLAEFANFHLAKLFVAAIVGHQAVAAFEVASRAVLALRSVPVAGLETYLPAASVSYSERKVEWRKYLALTRLAGYGAVICLAVPLAMGPVGLYVFAGSTGDLGKWAFMLLSVGVMLGVVAVPAATLLQATGNAQILAKVAVISMVSGVPLGWLLTRLYGLEGAAGSSAMVVASTSIMLGWFVHRLNGESPLRTLSVLADLWPFVLICAVWGIVAYDVYVGWIETLSPVVRYSRYSRIFPGLVTLCATAILLAVLALVYWLQTKRRSMDREWLRILHVEDAPAAGAAGGSTPRIS